MESNPKKIPEHPNSWRKEGDENARWDERENEKREGKEGIDFKNPPAVPVCGLESLIFVDPTYF